MNSKAKMKELQHRILPNISIDCVVFGFDFEKLNVLLVERKLEVPEENIHISDYTLTGYHIFEDEDLDTAAARILKDLTGLDNIYLEQFYAFGGLQRVASEKDQLWLKHINQGFADRIITVGYYSLIDSTKFTLAKTEKNAQWVPVDQLDELEFAFDHREILDKALEALRKKVRMEPVAFQLLPDRFTLTQLQKVFESILGIRYDKRNYRKKINQMPFIVPLNEKQKGVSHKPAQLFIFSTDIFSRMRKHSHEQLF